MSQTTYDNRGPPENEIIIILYIKSPGTIKIIYFN